MYTDNPDAWNPSFDDGAEAPLIAAEPVEAREDDTTSSICISIPENYTPDTPHSHDVEQCLGGRGHGQGLPAYSCGCYIRTKVDPGLVLIDLREQYHEPERLEQDINNWITQVEGHSGIGSLKRKKPKSKSTFELGDITTPHGFGQNLTNVERAKLMPALETPKRRKLGKAFELTQTRETLVVDVVKHIEAAIDRQTEVLSKICRVLESSTKQKSGGQFGFMTNCQTDRMMTHPLWIVHDQLPNRSNVCVLAVMVPLHEVTSAPQYNYSHVNERVWHLNRTKCLSSVWWVIFAFVTPSLLPGGLYITQFVRYFATRTLCGSCDLEWSGWLEKNGHHFIWKHDGGDTIASISSVIQSAASCDRFEPSGHERVDMG
ncbi:hypothetical protein BD769DRAFT_1389585 [Suillus cothurnatus]|nr:hypothetical protein BD769DRAFT_1389585 [Suillus cothurnatus]